MDKEKSGSCKYNTNRKTYNIKYVSRRKLHLLTKATELNLVVKMY